MPTTPQSVTLVIAIVDRPRRPGRNDQHVQGLFYTPAEDGGRLDRRDIQEARGFQGHRLQVPRDGGPLAEAARPARQGQRARPVPAAVFDTVFITRMSEAIFHR